ncbi:pilin [Candidatus Gracilibacteria bacterium]|nr:pilin [Candidatus Gracilibacteria bacterium]MCF7856263.1 pilin [Candidatus Gracilibacteria bacterium]MCF7896258.1 pilin [Candidatus Gracilibacteria bacterium]
MLKLKQKIFAGILASFAMLIFASNSLAAGTTLIPSTVPKEEIDAAKEIGDQAEVDRLESQNSLAQKFQKGEFELYDLGTYTQYLIEFLIYLAGGIAVLFIVIGGYKYMVGSISDDKEAGKKTIAYALAGFAIAVLAWTVVNFLQVWLTSGS